MGFKKKKCYWEHLKEHIENLKNIYEFHGNTMETINTHHLHAKPPKVSDGLHEIYISK